MSKLKDSMLSENENPKLISKEELKARNKLRKKFIRTPFDSRQKETLEMQYAQGYGIF